ncbi:MAG: CAP domain-containing protein [Acidobacteriota bacterium]|nr:MAG: CAP domain-containing protein [Acidobacteriota bacterium]
MKNPLKIAIVFAALVLCFLTATPPVPAQTATATGKVASGRTTLKSPPDNSRPRVVLAASELEAPERETSRAISTSEDLEKRVFDLINAKRIEAGAAPLSWSGKVAKVARNHSREMALYDYFSHTDVEGNLVDRRATNAGIKKWTSIGENIAYLRGYDDPALNAVERWMLSPSHRENLLDPRWKESGIGLAITSDGTYFFTQVFVVE